MNSNKRMAEPPRVRQTPQAAAPTPPAPVEPEAECVLIPSGVLVVSNPTPEYTVPEVVDEATAIAEEVAAIIEDTAVESPPIDETPVWATPVAAPKKGRFGKVPKV